MVGGSFNFQALEWAEKVLLISAAMLIGKLVVSYQKPVCCNSTKFDHMLQQTRE